MRPINDVIKSVKLSLPSKKRIQEHTIIDHTDRDKTFQNTKKSMTSKRPATPDLKTQDNKTLGRTAKTPAPKKRQAEQSRSKSSKRLERSKSKKPKNQLITGSKYFANIFGEVAAINYFNDTSKDQPIRGASGEKLLQTPFQQSHPLQDQSNAMNDKTGSLSKVQSEKLIKRASIDDTEFDLLKENSYMLTNQSPTKNLFKSEVHTLSKDQLFDLLLKTSEVVQKFGNLKNSFASLVSALPIQSLKVQNLKPLYHLVPNKNLNQNAEMFHQRCDNKGPYLGFVRHSGGIFGFFIEGDFCDEFEVYHRSSLNMIFTIVSPQSDRFVSFKVKKGKEQFALCNTEDGFCLGMPTSNNRDLYMNFDDLKKCSSKLGFAYDVSGWNSDHIAGKYADWNISEIEILQLVNHSSAYIARKKR